VKETAKLLEGMGHQLEEYTIKFDLEKAWTDYNDVIAVEAANDFAAKAEIVGRPVEEKDLAPFNWSMLQHGRSISGMQYARSAVSMRKANQQLGQELAPFDVFLTPTLTQPPRPVGYWSMEEPDLRRYLARWSDAGYMFAFNLSGLPAMSVPAAISAENKPIGVQMVGRHGDEALLLRLARQMEQALRWDDRRPPLCAV
jgi:amidase